MQRLRFLAMVRGGYDLRRLCAITGGRNGCLTLANPGEIRLDALKQAGHSIY